MNYVKIMIEKKLKKTDDMLRELYDLIGNDFCGKRKDLDRASDLVVKIGVELMEIQEDCLKEV